MEFKIGDKVKVTYKVSLSSKDLAGKICTIKEIGSDWYVLEEDLKDRGVWEDEIELYEEEFPEKWWIYPKTISEIEAVCKWFDKNHNNEEVGVFYSGQKLKTGYTNAFQKGNVYFEHKPEEATEITFDQFKKHILKESTIMKNLLETEFVIENCTLSQRLAIKAYCDEKKIKYWSENTFTNEQAPCIHWDLEEFLCGITGGNKNVITFSELIQFLDSYQPKPEFKVNDFLITIKDSGNATSSKSYKKSYYGEGVVLEIEKFEPSSNGLLAVCKNGYVVYLEYTPTKFVRHATPEEIKKWKEENEIKLPKIGSYSGEHSTTKLKWGCTTISIATIKELLSLSLQGITLNGYVLDNEKVQQIKKFIEHNKL